MILPILVVWVGGMVPVVLLSECGCDSLSSGSGSASDSTHSGSGNDITNHASEGGSHSSST